MDCKSKPTENHHGVLVNIDGNGIFIIGDAGIGKSSLALELLYQGHQLIADDYVEFSKPSNKIIGHCPTLLENILHTRELGLLSISNIFGQHAWTLSHSLDYVVSLKAPPINHEVQFSPEKRSYSILGQQFPLLSLSTHSPASLSHRIYCWLSIQKNEFNNPEIQFKHKHQQMMARTPHSREILWP